MKKNYMRLCIAVCFFMYINLSAQIVDIATTGLVNPVGIAIQGNDLFISSIGNMSLRKKDLSDTSTTATTEVLPNVNFGIFMVVKENDLYIPLFTENRVVKMDLTNPIPTLVDVVSVNSPIGLAFRNNELYISERENGKIVKIDITQSNPTPVDVITQISGTTVNGIAFKGDDLYISHGGIVSKVTVTDAVPTLTELTADIGAVNVAFSENFMYITQPTPKTISRIDISQPTLVVDEFLTLPEGPWGIIIEENDLYISEQIGNRVFRFDLTTLSVNDSETVQFTYYPNPTKDYLHITGLTKNTPYTLTDQHGKEIMRGKLDSVDKLDLSTVANGMYFLKLNTYEVKKIIKY